ncbi:hypothetical protein [Trinickia mobilis]|uniref:hypothetical protein n=1 Tax=Trinickia mobilis TaxID=2816356 RepID=UPI001A8D4306|nr:hypothetical protein [Trinickia mobilis]
MPAPAAPAPVETTEDTGLYGVVIAKPIGGFPECPTQVAVPADNDAPAYACFQHADARRYGFAPFGTETLYVKWPAGKQPDLVNGYSMCVSIINGIVEGIRMSTRGFALQQRNYRLLEARFGRPAFKWKVTMKSQTGARFEVLKAAWKRPGRITIVYDGAENSPDSGALYIVSAREQARTDAALEQNHTGGLASISN